MSNFLAIATATATLKRMLQNTIAVPGATVTTDRPGSPQNGTPGPGINLYLYQVTPNAAWRNVDLPTRRLRAHSCSALKRPWICITS